MRVCVFAGGAIAIASILVSSVAQAQQVGRNAGAKVNILSHERQWVQYRIVSGRLVGSSGISSNVSQTQVAQTPARNEKITLQVNAGTPTVKYELHSPSEDLSFDLIAGKQFSARRTSKTANGSTFEFLQPDQDDITLTLGEGPNRRTAHAPNIWRLAITDGELCRQTIFPLLETLRPDWGLTALTNSVEEALFRLARGGHTEDRRQWQAWVDDLGSEKFWPRMKAQRKLLEVGPSVAPFLEELDLQQLDPEQRERVRDLIAQFSRDSEDSVEEAAASLAADPEVWLSLLSRSGESRRRLAAGQLSKCLGRPIEFDPAADGATRREQISRLRAALQANAAAESDKSPASPEVDVPVAPAPGN